MTIAIIIVFALSLIGMAVVIGIHFREIVTVAGTSVKTNDVPETPSQHAHRLAEVVLKIENYVITYVIPQTFKLLERVFMWLEKLSKELSSYAGKFRISMHEKGKVEPKESVYWNELRHWKKENGKKKPE